MLDFWIGSWFFRKSNNINLESNGSKFTFLEHIKNTVQFYSTSKNPFNNLLSLPSLSQHLRLPHLSRKKERDSLRIQWLHLREIWMGTWGNTLMIYAL